MGIATRTCLDRPPALVHSAASVALSQQERSKEGVPLQVWGKV